MKTIARIFFCMLLLTGCSSSDIFPAIGDHLSSPSGLAVDSAARRLYVTNSNSEVRYDWHEGSFQVLDITDARAPKLIRTALTKSFSGKIFLDLTARRAYTPNRFSSTSDATVDRLLTINIDESSADFLHVDETDLGLDPFGIACCQPASRLWITTNEALFQYADIAAVPISVGGVSLKRSLSTGDEMTSAQVSDVILIGSQAFLSRAQAGILVINLDEVNDPSKNPVDYFISDVRTPRGLATDGTLLYVLDEDVVNDNETRRVLVMNISSLTPLTDNATVKVLGKESNGLVEATIEVGKNPQEMVISGTQAFVTNADDNTVSMIDLTSRTVLATIAVGEEPFSLAVDAPGGVPTILYVGNLRTNSISIIDIPTRSWVTNFTQ